MSVRDGIAKLPEAERADTEWKKLWQDVENC